MRINRLLSFAAFTAVLPILGGCPSGSKQDGAEDMVVITSDRDLGERHRQLQELTEGPLIKYVKGEELTEQDLKNLEKAEPIARGVKAFNSSVYTSHLVLGQIQLPLGKRDEALSNMLQCIALAPPEGKRTDDDKFIIRETLNDIGNIYYGNGQYDEAESYVRQAVNMDPENIKYLGNMVQILHAADRNEEARQVLERIRKIKPDSETLKALELLLKPPAAAPKK